MSELAILVPVLARPHRVKPLLASIHNATPDARVLFLTDPGDEKESAAIRRELKRTPLDVKVDACGGNYASKINRGVEITGEPYIVCGADDLHFHPGWFRAAKRLMNRKIGVVATNDLCNPRTMAGNLATHPLVARWYAELGTIDEPGKLMHEGYPHEYVDQELTETAIKRGAFLYASDAVVEHLHPDVGKAPMDDLYAARDGRMRQGRKLYRQRRKQWT